jgi:CRISPR-associated protein Csm3
MAEYQEITLHGRIILDGVIEALTGLHIGGSPGALAIGGVDLPVIRNPVNQQPYIPGSSLKGKMRSLWEKAKGVKQNRSIGKGVSIHACEAKLDYERCPVCQIYGTLGQSDAAFPTRIVVRDAPLDATSLQDAKTDLPFSEVKWEAAIDRITSAATPRQIERVPAGALFSGMQIVFNIYHSGDRERFLDVLTALQLVEDDYLGGHGSRGSGRVAFKQLAICCKRTDQYSDPNPPQRTFDNLRDVLSQTDLKAWIAGGLPVNGGG